MNVILLIYMYFCRRDYQRCLRLDVCYLPARVNLAYTLQMAGFYQQAWQQFTAAININKCKIISRCIRDWNASYWSSQ